MLYDSFACGLLGCTLVASVLIDHSGYALVPYQNWPLVYNPWTTRRYRITYTCALVVVSGIKVLASALVPEKLSAIRRCPLFGGF